MDLYHYSISWVGCIEIFKLPIDDRIYWDSIPVLQHVQDAGEEIDTFLLQLAHCHSDCTNLESSALFYQNKYGKSNYYLCVERIANQIKVALKDMSIGLSHLKDKIASFKYFNLIIRLQTTWTVC